MKQGAIKKLYCGLSLIGNRTLTFFMLFMLEFPNDCSAFYPPLSDDCLHYLWIEVAGCSVDGAAYPADDVIRPDDDKWINLNQK